MWSLLSTSSSRELEPEDQVDMAGRTPLVLLGSDSSPLVLRDSLAPLGEWELLLTPGILYGAQCVWAPSLNLAGTPEATLMAGTECQATLALVDAQQLEALQDRLGLNARKPQGCRFETEDEAFEEPAVLAPFEGVLSVGGQPRAVASAASYKGAKPMLMIELADWICLKAREYGLEIYTPNDLREHAGADEVAKAISGVLPHGLELD